MSFLGQECIVTTPQNNEEPARQEGRKQCKGEMRGEDNNRQPCARLPQPSLGHRHLPSELDGNVESLPTWLYPHPLTGHSTPLKLTYHPPETVLDSSLPHYLSSFPTHTCSLRPTLPVLLHHCTRLLNGPSLSWTLSNQFFIPVAFQTYF